MPEGKQARAVGFNHIALEVGHHFAGIGRLRAHRAV